jgi:hypothetical protein
MFCAAGGQVWVGLSGDAAGLGWYGLRLRRPESSRGLPRPEGLRRRGSREAGGIGWAGFRWARGRSGTAGGVRRSGRGDAVDGRVAPSGCGAEARAGCGAPRVDAELSGDEAARAGRAWAGVARGESARGSLVVGVGCAFAGTQWVMEMNSPVWVARTWPPGWSAGRVSDEVRTGRRVPSGAMRTVLGASSTTNSLALRRTTGAL